MPSIIRLINRKQTSICISGEQNIKEMRFSQQMKVWYLYGIWLFPSKKQNNINSSSCLKSMWALSKHQMLFPLTLFFPLDQTAGCVTGWGQGARGIWALNQSQIHPALQHPPCSPAAIFQLPNPLTIRAPHPSQKTCECYLTWEEGICRSDCESWNGMIILNYHSVYCIHTWYDHSCL